MAKPEHTRKRAALKAKLTIFNNYLQGFEAKVNDDAVTDFDYQQLQARKSTLDGALLAEFEEIQSQIESDVGGTDIDLTERAAFDEQYYDLMAKAEQYLKQFEKKEENSSSPVASTHSTENQSPFGLRLPPIDIPKFDGNFQTWLEYRDTYESMIHSSTALGKIQKFHYLRGSLIGAAALVVKSLEFSANNYDVAWNLLLERYNNPRILIQNHVKSLFNIESIQKESSGGIRALIDTVFKHMRCLEQVNEPTVDTLIIYLISTKLDNNTAREWEEYKNNKDLSKNSPTINDLKTFLNNKADLLETLKINNMHIHDKKSNHNTKVLFTGSQICLVCKQNHFISNCEVFLGLNVQERIKKVQALKLCVNCLKFGHHSKICRGYPCRTCSLKHHRLLHIERRHNQNNNSQIPTQVNNPNPDPNLTEPSIPQEHNENSTACVSYSPTQILLSTALVRVMDKNNKPHTIRVLLDSGSQSNFIRMDVINKLQLSKQEVNMNVACLNDITSKIRYKCDVTIQSLQNAFSTEISCLVLSNITGNLPSVPVNTEHMNIPANIKLSDPSFSTPSQIDALIGAEVFWSLICIGQISLGANKPVLQKSKLGWIISGPSGVHLQYGSEQKVQCNFVQNMEIQDQLGRFWEIEEGFTAPKVLHSAEEIACENKFVETTTRLSDGRFLVQIPLKSSPDGLGESFQQAKNQFLSLERKLETKPELKSQYVEFIREYENLGHMKKVQGQLMPEQSYYMPHHGILRENSLTTKLRVVFNGSMKTSNGVSFNDIQMIGPTIQNDLISILLRFRQHTYVVAADVMKMYRQILIEPNQRSLQRILWRESPNNPLSTYELQTVSYGTSSAPFLSIRCLMQLAFEQEQFNPEIASIIKEDFYVDDLLTGADTIQKAANIARDVTKILRTGCFELRKFYSNDNEVLKYVNNSESADNVLNFGENENAKTLGLIWHCHTDSLTYNIGTASTKIPVTKRTILAGTAQVFDPLGLLAVCIIKAKMLLQQLWLEKLSWDEAVPHQLHTAWTEFRDQLPLLNQLLVPRHVVCQNSVNVQIHGFSDSSETAYGGCIYVRSVNENGEVHVKLLCAKGKVAPLKSVTLPRLELCGALILSRLLNKVLSSLTIKFDECVLWCDSTVVLGWLKTPPYLLKTFVNSRVAEIQSITSNHTWRHVPSRDNPADLLSRGLTPRQVLESNMWFHGPHWLKNHKSKWPSKIVKNENLPEIKNVSESLHITIKSEFPFDKFSCFQRMNRIVGYLFRFIKNCRLQGENKHQRIIGGLTVQEILHAQNALIRIAQEDSFANDLTALKAKDELNRKSKILSLRPFLDNNLILRVGGRLTDSDFEYNKKHPILLDAKHKLTKLIFEYEHKRLLHAGPQHLLASIRDEYWPIGGRNLAKGIFRQCVICFKVNPKVLQPIMGNLPKERLQSGVPFNVTGVDYAGPYLIKDRKGRGAKTSKCWIALFICFATRAIHLELVTELSKDSFILSLKRFMSRRGKPSVIFSDNGTNFTATSSELSNLGDFLQETNNEIIEALSADHIEWKFIPPGSPHFGGIWEAGVKSSKFHLKRILGKTLLTYEELYTLLVQVEAVLNSRPLSPISSEPCDLNPLTPAHFLIGRPVTALPEPILTTVPENRLNRFQLLEQMRQHFWNRWQKEFVAELQQRVRWKTNQSQLKVGTLVVIKEDNTPVMNWRLGRVVGIHPGKDGVVRVATLRTFRGEIKRSLAKICPLPLKD